MNDRDRWLQCYVAVVAARASRNNLQQTEDVLSNEIPAKAALVADEMMAEFHKRFAKT